MKRIIMFFLFSGSLYPLMAQTTDSSHVNSASDTATMMNHSGTDTSHSMNNSSNMGNMSSGMNTSNSSMMNNTMNSGDPAALPVLENSIPDAVVAKAKEKFGTTLYDITCVKHTTDQNAYVVRTQTNGTYSTLWIDDSGNTMQ
jgi:hypothetical protein